MRRSSSLSRDPSTPPSDVALVRAPAGSDSVLHLQLLPDATIQNTIATRANALTRARLGDPFFDQIARSAVQSADSANVLRRILGKSEVTTSEDDIARAVAKWIADIGTLLGLPAPQPWTKEQIAAAFQTLVDTFQAALAAAPPNLVAAGQAYKTALDTLKFIAHQYPPQVAQPTPEALEIYTSARDSCR